MHRTLESFTKCPCSFFVNLAMELFSQLVAGVHELLGFNNSCFIQFVSLQLCWNFKDSLKLVYTSEWLFPLMKQFAFCGPRNMRNCGITVQVTRWHTLPHLLSNCLSQGLSSSGLNHFPFYLFMSSWVTTFVFLTLGYRGGPEPQLESKKFIFVSASIISTKRYLYFLCILLTVFFKLIKYKSDGSQLFFFVTNKCYVAKL